MATVNSGAAGFRLPNFGTVPADEKVVIVGKLITLVYLLYRVTTNSFTWKGSR